LNQCFFCNKKPVFKNPAFKLLPVKNSAQNYNQRARQIGKQFNNQTFFTLCGGRQVVDLENF